MIELSWVDFLMYFFASQIAVVISEMELSNLSSMGGQRVKMWQGTCPVPNAAFLWHIEMTLPKMDFRAKQSFNSTLCIHLYILYNILHTFCLQFSFLCPMVLSCSKEVAQHLADCEPHRFWLWYWSWPTGSNVERYADKLMDGRCDHRTLLPLDRKLKASSVQSCFPLQENDVSNPDVFCLFCDVSN